jgi:RNA polymerase sigma factor (sigma-70 family)
VTGGTTEESLAVRAGRLFAEFRAGEENKMADLVALLTPILWHTVRATRLDATTAEDVLQTVWLTLVRKADTIEEPLAVLQWLVVTAKRESWRIAKSQTRTRPEDLESSASPIADPTQDIEAEVIAAQSQRLLWRHVQQLSDRCQSLLRVIAFADRPDYADLARSLGMPQGSIGPTRGRCLAKLRVLLDNDPAWEAR